ncbi:heat-inducible transcription repressor HrcA [Zymomonas mobilis]|uniref:Heat-inducible transcription repressor HrcA n=1 Tax=Zymomonas mobilis TaxID=542 RepID=A0A542VZ34_ZYMMB|nr:heat-inducible transcriptional repressor HrcA [Zymomonas mobilis]TQL16588.1 heat-inducible transcription repressor HrcA [Zymomonas mobilis]
MSSIPVIELSSRARDIFQLVVESYLGSGLPVGSKTLASQGVNLSPASIRYVLQELETKGLLLSPHISAGRMPTELGLRLFVNGMMQLSEPSEEERSAIEADVIRGHSAKERLVNATMTLSGLSACAGLVLVPKQELVLKQLGFVVLDDNRALAIIVGSDGSVENRVIELSTSFPASALTEASNYINAHFSGYSFSEAKKSLFNQIDLERNELDSAASDLIQRGLAVWSEDSRKRPVLIVRGQSNLLQDASEDLDRAKQLLEELEDKKEIASLLEKVSESDAAQIFIGSENKLFSLSGSSVIASPYHGEDGHMVGVVAVIGPTRLNYGRIVPMVDFTAKTLSRTIA